MRAIAAWMSSCAFCAGCGTRTCSTFTASSTESTARAFPLKSVQLPHPPLYAGSRHEPGKEVIARDCDYWFVDCLSDYRLWERNMDQAAVSISDMNARAARHGRRVDYGMSCHVICADTTDAVDLANQLEEHGKASRVAFIAAKALGPGLVGTPELIADRIRRYEAAGVGTLMLHFHPMVEGMERFCAERDAVGHQKATRPPAPEETEIRCSSTRSSSPNRF